MAKCISLFLDEIDGMADKADLQRDIKEDDWNDVSNAKASSAAQRALRVLLEEDGKYGEHAWNYLEPRVLKKTLRTHWICKKHQEDLRNEYVHTGKHKGELPMAIKAAVTASPGVALKKTK
mmetsp:Transcript_1260/g.1918  ORF Transcript_1260/g.1918 Transcript_1260/m.1918 type:complete len:121 (-) Transcript_1260:89-451(-)